MYSAETNNRQLIQFINHNELHVYNNLTNKSFGEDSPLLKFGNCCLKRAFDITFSLLVIVFILSWLLPILALFIKLSSGGKVFFAQKRTGLDNQIFTCWKLNTMKPNKNANIKQATANDNRITYAGKFLRKYSLDELPQFWNVLIGDMSVIGPRPHMLHHTNEFSKKVKDYDMRHKVKPGITGLSQVLGYRGEIQNKEALHNRIRFDIFYLSKWNFLLDFIIIWETVKLIFFGDQKAY